MFSPIFCPIYYITSLTDDNVVPCNLGNDEQEYYGHWDAAKAEDDGEDDGEDEV